MYKSDFQSNNVCEKRRPIIEQMFYLYLVFQYLICQFNTKISFFLSFFYRRMIKTKMTTSIKAKHNK